MNKGTNPQFSSRELTELVQAAKSSNDEMVLWYIEHIAKYAKEGGIRSIETPALCLAAFHGYFEIVKLLCEMLGPQGLRSLDLDATYDYKTKDHNVIKLTALFVALRIVIFRLCSICMNREQK